MDPALRIVHLRQGVHSLKDHIQDCLDIAYLSDLLDCALIDFFFHELNEPLRSVLIHDGPRGSFYQFLDIALLLTALDSLWVLRRNVPLHIMAASQDPLHKMAASPEIVHKMAARPEAFFKMAASPETFHKMSAVPESRPVMAAFPESHPVMAAVSKSAGWLRHDFSVLKGRSFSALKGGSFSALKRRSFRTLRPASCYAL